ncbi:MAG: helix-turn-helix transcriptional regulator [Actinomycetota bacterium]|nr:helix-turn-helix transcriptional regulator [Actinomycetota bacterium]
MGLFDQTVTVRRVELDLSQTELAERIGVSQQTVSRWEGGYSIPEPERVIALADVLDLEKESLLVYAGYIPLDDRSHYWHEFQSVYDRIMHLSDKELILLLDKAWQEHRRRQGFVAPQEPPSSE